MSARALAAALPDFGAPDRHHRPAPSDPMPSFEPTAAAAAASLPLDSPAIDERIAEAEDVLRERLTTEHAEAMAELQAAHEAKIAALEARLGDELGAQVAGVLAKTERRLIEVTGAAAARILGMALGEDLEKRAVDSLARTIREAMADSDGLRIVVRGAPHLQDPLRAALGEHAGHLEFHEDSAFDLSVEIDDKVFETRLSEWSDALAGILA